MTDEELEAAFQAVPPEMVAEIIDGELVVQPRPAPRHANAAGELYAQEIVGRLGIAQSAVSRHLALLERAGVIRVRPHGGMKYYAVNCARMDALADALRRCSR